MKRPRQPLFHARQGYRRRRLTDAARLLPILGLFLFFLPVLWRPAATPEPDTAGGGVYLFAVWFILILVAGLLARLLSGGEPGRPQDGEERD
ncbi:MAG: hypothetical protein R3D97_01335 [Paracoccaceae bacterium]